MGADSSIAETLMQRAAAKATEAARIAATAETHNRSMSSGENEKYDQLMAEAGQIQERAAAILKGEEASRALEISFRQATGKELSPENGSQEQKRKAGDLSIPFEALEMIALESRAGRGFTWCADDSHEALVEQRANLTTATYGFGQTWFSPNGLPAPVSLSETVGIETLRESDLKGSIPVFPLNTPTPGGVAEGTGLSEGVNPTAANPVNKRFGRWNSYSVEASLVRSVEGILASHQAAIILDQNATVVTNVVTAAGAAVAAGTTKTASTLTALGKVAGATGRATVSDLTLVMTAAAYSALAGTVVPASVSAVGESMLSFGGAKVFIVPAGSGLDDLHGLVLSPTSAYNIEARGITVESAIGVDAAGFTLLNRSVATYTIWGNVAGATAASSYFTF